MEVSMIRTISILIISLALSVVTTNMLHAQGYAYDAVIYVSEEGTTVLACADDGQAAFMSLTEQKLLVGTYKISDDYNSFVFLAKDTFGVVYAQSEFRILSENIIQEVNSSIKFYRQ